MFFFYVNIRKKEHLKLVALKLNMHFNRNRSTDLFDLHRETDRRPSS